MRGARSRIEAAVPASESPGPEDEGQLNRLLQCQLEEDVARIFDESIHSDLDVEFGKLKILTHSCILKTRANNFYQKLESVSQQNIGRNSYDEVYSFVSDVYTECDIKYQEKEILKYLDETLIEINKSDQLKAIEDQELFLTPKCLTPNSQATTEYLGTATISTELNKDLVSVVGNILEKELNEQDALSNAFQSILNQSDEINSTASHSKPTTLSLNSSLCPKLVEQFSKSEVSPDNNVKQKTEVQIDSNFDTFTTSKGKFVHTSDSYNGPTFIDKSQDQAYSPDSLITDEPSSSSDYLSAAYPFSPGASFSGVVTQLNVSTSSSIKMEDKNSLDSGLERSDPSDLSRSLSSNRDVTLTDVSLTESTLQDLTMDEAHAGIFDTNNIPIHARTTTSTFGPNFNTSSVSQRSPTNGESASSSEDSNVPNNRPIRNTRPTKAEKQRQNEEIHVMESSSLSSEAGSWESVFPPKPDEGVICLNIVNGECQHPNQAGAEGMDQDAGGAKRPKFKYVSPFVKATACFIDASSLLDDTEDNTIKIWPSARTQIVERIIEPPSQMPVPLSNAELKSEVVSAQTVEPVTQQAACSTAESASGDMHAQTAEPSTQQPVWLTAETTLRGLGADTVEPMIRQAPSSTAESASRAVRAASLESPPQSRPSCTAVAAHALYAQSLESRPTLSAVYSTPRVVRPQFVPPSQYIKTPTTQSSYTAMPSTSRNLETEAVRAPTAGPSQPLPCSQGEWNVNSDESDGDETDDSLEKSGDVDDSFEVQTNIQRQSYPTVFDMTPSSDDFLCTASFESVKNSAENIKNMRIEERQSVERDTKRSSINEERSLQYPQQFVIANTPHNSILTVKATLVKPYESDDNESDSTHVDKENGSFTKSKKYNESSPIVSGGASIQDHLPQVGSASPMTKRKIENIPIVSGAYIPPVEPSNPRKTQKPSCVPAWVVDMSTAQQNGEKCSSNSIAVAKKPGDKQCDNIKNENKHHTFENGESRGSVDSDSSEKSSHKFYVDLSSLPDPIPPKRKDKENEKKNIFSMYIGLDEKSTAKKEMPVRLSSSLNARKNTGTDSKPKTSKQEKEAPNTNTQNSIPDKRAACAFEKLESLCNNPNISISDILKLPKKKNVEPESGVISAAQFEAHARQAYERHGIPVQMGTAEVDPETGDLFVRLSDLDRPIPRPEMTRTEPLNNAMDVRMSRSIPENNWREPIAGSSRSIVDVISSFHSENAMSLNRLFPHLRNELSRSMPGSLSSRNQSPMRPADGGNPAFMEELLFLGENSDTSETSSALSSMCPSAVGNSTEENSQTSSLIGNCQSRLGQDLLRMFLEEIAPDVVVEVGGRRMKAHKCILSSRCQYFAGILSGGWVESAGNVIVLPPFSYAVVHFAMCHIYSGVSAIPDTVSILELATIADMLGLEGLKEAIMFTLKAKYCHNFHKPCNVCIAGVLECFPLTSIYGLDDLYERCLKWINKNFLKVWSTKAFATLPKDLLDKCLQELVNSITIENFVDTVYASGLAMMYVQNSGRWSETVTRLCRRLVNAAASFAAPRLVEVLRATATVPTDLPLPAVDAFRDCMASAIEWAPPDAACRAYSYLHSVITQMRMQHLARPDLIRNQNRPPQRDLLETFAAIWQLQCEGAIVRAAPRVVGTAAFNSLQPDLRRRLRDLGCIIYGTQALPASPASVNGRRPRNAVPPGSNRATKPANKIDIEQVRAAFIPYASKPPVSTAVDMIKINNDLRSSLKTNSQPKIRTTKAQEERAKYNLSKNNQSQERLNNKISRPYENAKPRYMEPKVPKEAEGKPSVPIKKRLGLKTLSSSESSRNSSPVQPRARARPRPAPEVPTRTAEPSTDSRSDSQASNKYATYTKAKNVAKLSAETPKPANLHPSQGAIKKAPITKIPVYSQGSNNTGAKPKEKKRSDPPANNVEEVTNGHRTRRPNSLMSATKSSSAKMVPKVSKETKSRQPKRGQTKRDNDAPESTRIMERSGTFLKDEPTFGNQSRFDIDSETE